jgi:hypothetical protein
MFEWGLLSCLCYLCVVMSDACCVVDLFSSSCVSCVASFSGLSIFDCPFGVLWRLFNKGPCNCYARRRHRLDTDNGYQGANPQSCSALSHMSNREQPREGVGLADYGTKGRTVHHSWLRVNRDYYLWFYFPWNWYFRFQIWASIFYPFD